VTLEGRTIGIYRVGRELGRGGMGTVHRAESTAEGPAGPAGTVVALKVFHGELVEDERAFARCRQEAEIGKEIRHEHLVRTYGIGSADLDGKPCHFMVMELIEGKTLKGLLAELGTFPEHLLYQVADQILAALHEIHERGVVHRDLKPENIVITPDHRVLLMDLGIARREAGHELTKAGEFIGSLVYAPPEQFTAAGVSRRSDLYALGITLFELATGQSPFPDADLTTLIRRKLEGEIPPPRSVNKDMDPFWDQVIATCARREKADRFATADELRRILREGEKSEWWRLRAAPSAEQALKRLRHERRTPLFGRAAATEQLREAYARAREAGAVLLVNGPSGAGKSRLVFDFLEGVAGAGGPALAAGRGAGAGSVAYGPFVEILGDLLGGAAGDRLPGLLSDMPGAVQPLLGFLRGALQPGPDTGLPKDALFAAVIRILRALAAERPIVVVVEDLHLAGAETAELFAHVARWVPGSRVLLLGVYSDDDLPEGSPVRGLSGTTLPLANLGDADTEELVRYVVRHERTVRALSPTLRAKSEGNPLIVLEALAHLQASGLLAEREGGLELTGPPDEADLPSTVKDLAALKLAELDEEQRETLEVASVLGGRFDAPLLAEVLGAKPIELLQRLAGLERKHRLVASSGKDLFRFSRRQLHEAIYEGIPEALRGEYHSLVADTLLRASPEGERAYAALRHLFLSERALEAEPFLESALDYMGANFHASYAAPFLEKVGEAFACAPLAKRLAIAMKLWGLYDLLGSRKDQMRVLDLARELAAAMGEPGPRARVHALRAGSYWYAGDYDHAGEEAQAGLVLAREASDRKWESTCIHTLGVVAYVRGRSRECSELWREALKVRREIRDRRGVASTLQALALVMPAIGEGDRALATMEESLAIWREIGERRGEAAMLMNIGNHLVDATRYDEGLRHLEQAIEGHRETGALLSEASALTNLGRAQEILGRIDDARASLERALRLFIDLGNPDGELAARLMLGDALGGCGEVDEARAHLEAAIRLAGSKGAKAKLATAHRVLGAVLHAAGVRDEAWTHLEQALALEAELKNAGSRVQTLGALGKAALAEADHERAVRYLGEALPDARNAGGIQAPVILCRLARAHRGAGRLADARECAREALERLESAGSIPTKEGPEIYLTLGAIHEDEGRRPSFLDQARAMIEGRAQRIRNDGYREHYLVSARRDAEAIARTA
jgi:tetratricopeptide (TPR) repeat protein